MNIHLMWDSYMFSMFYHHYMSRNSPYITSIMCHHNKIHQYTSNMYLRNHTQYNEAYTNYILSYQGNKSHHNSFIEEYIDREVMSMYIMVGINSHSTRFPISPNMINITPMMDPYMFYNSMHNV